MFDVITFKDVVSHLSKGDKFLLIKKYKAHLRVLDG